MGKPLVIVESPAKAKTISKFLGGKYRVEASMGHVRDLPPHDFGINVDKNFEPKYVIVHGRNEAIKKLKKLASEAGKVYLAPDLDREGEAIAWHLVQAIGLDPENAFRVTFNEITKKAITDAFKKPGKIDMSKVNAQQARRILDRIVGYKLSPLLWSKVGKGLSAGRVQSVAVKLIVDREKEIRAFKTREYWKVQALFDVPENGKVMNVPTELTKLSGNRVNITSAKEDGEKANLVSGEKAAELVKTLRPTEFVVSGVTKKEMVTKSSPPFNTSLLQQQASIKLSFSGKRTMMLAQQLYEGIELGEDGSVGLITYMRTDSFRVSDEAITEARDFIKDTYGPEYVPEKANFYPSKKGAQEAHEAIRPTSMKYSPDSLRQHLTADQLKLYSLIWDQFIASQMANARQLSTTVELQSGEAIFACKGKAILFDGYLRVADHHEPETIILPNFQEGQKFKPTDMSCSQHSTKPPARYTEAALIKSLEREGIGRPSTYATIISTIQERNYVGRLDEKGRPFYPTDLGILVNETLEKHFPDILNVEFTSQMEEQLDEVEENNAEWLKVVRTFYEPFKTDLEKAYQTRPEASEEKCPECSSPLLIRLSLTGKFLACSGFPKCKYTRNLGEETEHKCDKCGKTMLLRSGAKGRYLACSNYPECRNTKDLRPDGSIAEPRLSEELCEKCGKPMAMRYGKTGQYLACSGYPDCTSTRSMSPPAENTEEKCDKCGSPMVIRTGRRGRFLACSAFPKCRNSKNLSAPPEQTDRACDKCGKPMVIKIGRRGKFLACSGFPECKNACSLNGMPTEQPVETDELCEKCGKKMVVRTGKYGKFLACSNYPKCKNAKPITPADGTENNSTETASTEATSENN